MDISNERKQIDEIDASMRELFVRRMDACREIAKKKKAAGVPIYDAKREADVLSLANDVPAEYASLYKEFLQSVMRLAKKLESNE